MPGRNKVHEGDRKRWSQREPNPHDPQAAGAKDITKGGIIDTARLHSIGVTMSYYTIVS